MFSSAGIKIRSKNKIMLRRFFRRKKSNREHFEALSQKIEQKKRSALAALEEKHQQVDKWAKKKGINVEEIAGAGARNLATGVATSAMILSSGFTSGGAAPANHQLTRQISQDPTASITANLDVTARVRSALKGVNPYDSKKVAARLSKVLKIPVKAELKGINLNTNYGIMGYESHLTRYPGDSLYSHFETGADFQKFSHASMAGGPGAWGYLAPSRSVLSKKNIEREKYYLVVQTFLSPDWGKRAVKEWFRHRKMVVVNPKNGVVVVGAIEDAGPAEYTGRAFGGSPEVMEELGFSGGGDRVFMYFVNDPKDIIPLGRYSL